MNMWTLWTHHGDVVARGARVLAQGAEDAAEEHHQLRRPPLGSVRVPTSKRDLALAEVSPPCGTQPKDHPAGGGGAPAADGHAGEADRHVPSCLGIVNPP